jgi:chemotaxis family two-component system response regulator Rcp1
VNPLVNTKLIDILLVDDNPDDVELTVEALKSTKLANRIAVVEDGVEAIEYLNRRGKYTDAIRPSLILLDLNMPRKDGRQVLEEIKADEDLKTIPVVILTTSQAEEDIVRSYELHCNCYISKPVDLEQFTKVVRTIDDFWFAIVSLPATEGKKRKPQT